LIYYSHDVSYHEAMSVTSGTYIEYFMVNMLQCPIFIISLL